MNNVVNPTASSAISTQNEVHATRLIDGTVYHNTTAKPLFVAIQCSYSTGDALAVYSDATATPTLLVCYLSNGNLSNIREQICFWVLPGNYYKATKTALTSLEIWMEYS